MKCKFPPIFFNALGFKGEERRIHPWLLQEEQNSNMNTTCSTTNALKTTYLVKHLLFDSPQPISLQSAHRTKLNEAIFHCRSRVQTKSLQINHWTLFQKYIFRPKIHQKEKATFLVHLWIKNWILAWKKTPKTTYYSD